MDPKPSPPELKYSFEALNIPGLSANFLGAGASMMTLNFVDGNHLLVTYGLRDLVPRLVGDPPEDDDRLVGAELVELPSGKVLARTRWHLHDHGRYLWPLSSGRFLLRQADQLYTFAPLANLGSRDAFRRVPLPYRGGVLDAVVVSTDGKLLTLETHQPEKKKLTGIDINVLTSGDLPARPEITYDFYRISGSGSEESPLIANRAGSVAAPGAVRLPIDGDGYLVSSGGKRGRWKVEFESFAGSKPLLVGVVDSNCQPGLELISPDQFLAFTCRTAGTDGVTVAAYDFAQHDIWEEPMGSFALNFPVFVSAPTAGRFAISRKLETPAQGVSMEQSGNITSQEIRVYGTQSGDMLLKVYCVPVFRTSENFDLSPDGMRVAVVRNGVIEIYRLPALSKTDRADLAELAKLNPAAGSGPVNLKRLTRDTAEEIRESNAAATAGAVPPDEKTTASTTAPAVPPPVPPVTVPALASDSAGPASSPAGDLQVRRKPPTLLNPGETAEADKKSTSSRQQPQ